MTIDLQEVAEQEQCFFSPKPCNLNRATIESAGMYFAKHFNITFEMQLSDLVERFKGTLFYRKDNSGSQCSIEIPAAYPREQFAIRLDPFPSPEADRLGVAHELGHFFLHYLPMRKIDPNFALRADFHFQAESIDIITSEIEADWFAYGFLLSDEVVQDALMQALNNKNDATTLLATRQRVPLLVAEERVASFLTSPKLASV